MSRQCQRPEKKQGGAHKVQGSITTGLGVFCFTAVRLAFIFWCDLLVDWMWQ